MVVAARLRSTGSLDPAGHSTACSTNSEIGGGVKRALTPTTSPELLTSVASLVVSPASG